jgi:hypothetical protein
MTEPAGFGPACIGPAVVAAIYALWFAASLLGQFPALSAAKRRINLFGLIPNWFLFVGSLVTRDSCLYYRVRSAPEAYGEWRRLSLLEGRPPFWFLFYPQRRPGKAMIDICSQLISLRLLHRGDRARIEASDPYHRVLGMVRSRVNGGAEFQFCFMLERKGAPAPGNPILFLSSVHR